MSPAPGWDLVEPRPIPDWAKYDGPDYDETDDPDYIGNYSQADLDAEADRAADRYENSLFGP